MSSKTVPAANAVVVTKSDTIDIPMGTAAATRALYVGTGGNISVEMERDGSAIIFTSVQGGSILRISITRVNSTSTTASNMVALW